MPLIGSNLPHSVVEEGIIHRVFPLTRYIPPKLTQGKIWYISFSCKHPATGKMKRVRIKFNRGDSLSERKKEARAVIASLDLKLGWNPFIEEAMPKGFALMSDVLDKFIDIKSKESEANSMRCYNSFIKTFKGWLFRIVCSNSNIRLRSASPFTMMFSCQSSFLIFPAITL